MLNRQCKGMGLVNLPKLNFFFTFSFFDKDKPEKWLSRGFDALEQENFPISVECLSFALVYCPAKNATLRSTAYAWRAEAKYRMGKVAEAQADIASSRKADPSLAKVSFKFASFSKWH